MHIIVHYNLDYLLMINGIPFKKLGLAIFGGEGVATFRGSSGAVYNRYKMGPRTEPCGTHTVRSLTD